MKGTGAQSVIIQKLGVTANTTLITMGTNSRVEDFTANLSSSGNFNLTGVHFPGATPTTAKLRNSIWTITSTSVNGPTIVGVLADGATTAPTTAFVTANAIQRSSINVISSSTGISRGIYITGANRFPVRDIVINARGTGTNIVGVETTNANAFADIKTTTIFGTTYDINRSAGNIQLGFTDLVNNNANGNGFTVSTEPSHIYCGIIGNINSSATHYLGPGTITYSNLEASEFGISFAQPIMIFESVFRSNSLLSGTSVATVTLHKNSGANPAFITSVLNNATQTVKSTATSEAIGLTDTLVIKLVTTGSNIGQIPLMLAVGTY